MTLQNYHKVSRRYSYTLNYLDRVHARGNDRNTMGVKLVLLAAYRDKMEREISEYLLRERLVLKRSVVDSGSENYCPLHTWWVMQTLREWRNLNLRNLNSDNFLKCKNTHNVLKIPPDFSLPQWKRNKMKKSEEFRRTLTQWFCCGRSGSRVLEFGYRLGSVAQYKQTYLALYILYIYTLSSLRTIGLALDPPELN